MCHPSKKIPLLGVLFKKQGKKGVSTTKNELGTCFVNLALLGKNWQLDKEGSPDLDLKQRFVSKGRERTLSDTQV